MTLVDSHAFTRSAESSRQSDKGETNLAEPVLKKGSTGDAVRQLQQALTGLSYHAGTVDGQFAGQTEAAVKAFQSGRGLTADGIVGEITWRNIDEADTTTPALREGSTGNPVRRAQRRLTRGGWDTGGVGGVFGARTGSAVKRWIRV